MFNKVFLIGRLGADPELRYTQNNTAVATMRLATNDYWIDKATGEKKESTEWHRVVVWGKQAEQVEKFLKKGRQVFIEGAVQTREWQDKDGNKRWSTEIRASNVRFLDRVEGAGPSRAQEPPPHSDTDAPADHGFSDDDIPF